MLQQFVIPAQKSHAVVAMALGVDFKEPLDVAVIQRLAEVYDSSDFLKSELPIKAPLNGITFNIKNKNFLSEDTITGFDFRHFDKNSQLTWNVSVRPDFIACNCMSYERWGVVKQKTISLLTPFLNEFKSEGINVRAVGLEYQDAFTITKESPPNILDYIFSKNATLLPPAVFSYTDAWHIHSGWLQDSPRNRRILNNMQIELEPNMKIGEKYLRINGQHKLYSELKSGESCEITIQDFDHVLDLLHEINKDLLVNILSKDTLSLINLSKAQ